MKKDQIPDFTENDLVSAELSKETDPQISKQSLDIEKSHSNKGFIISLILIISGIVSFFLGITGVVNLSAELDGFKLKLLNCSPGVLIIIVGLGFYWLSKPKITIK